MGTPDVPQDSRLYPPTRGKPYTVLVTSVGVTQIPPLEIHHPVRVRKKENAILGYGARAKEGDTL